MSFSPEDDSTPPLRPQRSLRGACSRWQCSVISLLVSICFPFLVSAKQVLYVAPDGNDAWAGTAEKPLASLAGARDAIRKIKVEGGLPDGGIEVVLGDGTYNLAEPLALNKEDSGTAEAPITYRSANRGKARLSGGHALTGFTKVTDPKILNRLDPAVRDKILQVNIKEQGMPSLGNAVNPVERLEFFFKSRPMTLARWPNEGWTVVKDVPKQDKKDGTGGQIIYLDERADRWVDEPEVWLYGPWRFQWADDFMRVTSIDPDKNLITFAPPRHTHGLRKFAPYVAWNVLCELDQPGEWYLHRDTGLLYFYPPEPLEAGQTEVSRAKHIMVFTLASHITFDGFVIEASQSDGVVIKYPCNDITFLSCTVHNTGDAGIRVKGCKNVSVIGCDITETGGHGIDFIGGSKTRLESANLLAFNNHIWRVARWKRFMRIGINIYGVGHRVAHNLIHDMPHSAMWVGGNDHMVEFNEIHSVCYEANDAGAIYSGRSWTSRGNVVRNNFIHNVHGMGGRFVMGVYLDDMFSSMDIYNNLFYRVLNAVIIGGGRDNNVTNNIFVESGPVITVDDRALNAWAAWVADAWLKEYEEKGIMGLEGVAIDKPPYSERYPKLAKIMEGNPKAPEGNVIARNISYNSRWSMIYHGALKYVKQENNLIDVDPKFVDPENLDFQLRDDSPAFALGFKRFPISRIGLLDDGTRASWPVHHEVVPLRREHRAWPTPLTVLRVPRTTKKIEIDGKLGDSGWGGDEAAVMVNENLAGDISYGLEGGSEKADSQPSRAWVVHDGTHLLIAVHNPVSTTKPLRLGNSWGGDDAVEIAISKNTPGFRSPILVLRGYPSGHFASDPVTATTAQAARRAAVGVLHKTRTNEPGLWTSEWSIPFESLDVDPAKDKKLAFNITVRKSADNQWRLWRGTGTATYEVFEAGFIELE